MRSNADPRAITAAARGILRAVAPDVPPRFRTFAEIYSASLGARHFNLTLVAVFAGTALATRGRGHLRRHDLQRDSAPQGDWPQVALGASRGQVARIILGQGLTTTAIGVALGVVASVGLTRTIKSLLFGVAPTDPADVRSVDRHPRGGRDACLLRPCSTRNGRGPIEALDRNELTDCLPLAFVVAFPLYERGSDGSC